MEIREEHVEWATVHRMRDMLEVENAEYRLTQCFTLFTGILCWTLQRIRTEENKNDPIASAMGGLAKELSEQPFSSFVRLHTRPIEIDDRIGGHGRVPLPFNDFSRFEEGGRPFSALRTLIALRNSVAHGDARRVLPENRGGLLVGYRLLCQELDKKKVSWEGAANLDRHGMTRIADRLAERFCKAIDRDYPGLVADARTMTERR